MTNYKEWPDATIDLLIGGTPCQSFSVAGLRKGLDDPRGNLALTFIGLVDKYRPRWVVWENVPGVFSSSGGSDFESFIRGMAEIGYFGAWRVLDAQWFGVAQRRRRVFAVFCAGDWRPAAAVLFEPESLRGDSAPSREAGQDVTPTIRAGASNGGPDHGARSGDSKDELIVPVVAGTLLKGGQGAWPGGSAVEGHGAYIPEIANPLTARMHKGINTTADEGQTPIVTAFAQNTRDEVRLIGGDGQIAGALAAEPGMKQQTYLAFKPCIGRNGRGEPEEISPPLHSDGGDTSDTRPCVFSIMPQNSWKDYKAREVNVAQPVMAGGPVGGNQGRDYVMNSAVRRLTPRECERLQGFPDNYTRIPWRGKKASKCPDGPRYKALGNSMAVPVVRWIGERIKLFESIK